MKNLRAFVGHSFTDEDEQVVGKFLKYLDAIQELNPNFKWEHAENAEPSAIDDKVLRLFEDKDTFIGICTRKEQVIHPSKLRKGTFFSTRLFARGEDFSWKTSDWVIQEIGYALGRGMNVILLVEEGVRSPGGIQGSLEYISFNRDKPEQSFAKLLQMIASLSSGEVRAVEPELIVNDLPDSTEVEADSGWLLPDHTWDRSRYEISFMHCMAIEDDDGADAIADAFLKSNMGSNKAEAKSWSAFSEYMKILFGKAGRLDNIKDMARSDPDNAGILKYLGRAYKVLGEDQAAAESFVAASRLETDPQKRIDLLASAIEASAEKYPAIAQGALASAKSLARGIPELSASVLSIENSFSRARKENGFMFASLERLLESSPDDSSRRFELAYAYAEVGRHDMALFHYSRIPYRARNYSSWNNLGVAYDNQKLPIKSIYAYKKSKDLGNTLAMSNLANRFLQAGFLDEARELCEEAVRMPDHHENVDNSLARIKNALEGESETEKKIVLAAEEASIFYRQVGDALVSTELPDLPADWIYDGVKMVVSIEAGELLAQGVAEEKSRGLMRGLYPADEKPEIYDITITGVIRGRAVHGTYKKERRGAKHLVSLIGGEDKDELILLISADGASIEILRGKADKFKRERMTKFDRTSSVEIMVASGVV